MSSIGQTATTDVVPLRHHGRTFAAVVVAFLTAALLYSVFTNDKIHWDVVRKAFFSRPLLNGVWVTLLLTVIAMVSGVVLGTLSAIGALSTNFVLRSISTAFTWFFRGTPLVVQILFWFNLALFFPRIGPWDTNNLISPFTAAALALSLNEGAYMSEIVRAGIQSVDRGQTEAAQSLGLSPVQTLRRVVLPQAMRIIVPPTGNETISMLKSTSLVSVIGSVYDLLTRAQITYRKTGQVIDYLIAVSLWYLFLTSILTVAQYFIERHFGKGFAKGSTSSATRRLGFGKAPA
jgi:polar amino acid transport system permease protein